MSGAGMYSDVYKQDSPDGRKHFGSSAASMDPESLKNFDFTEETVRKGFIRKVYSILMCQLAFTVGVISLFLYHQPTRIYTYEHPWILISAFLATLVIIISMTCCENVRRNFPINFICLGLFTLAESILLGTFASTYNADEVMLAVCITIVLCLCLTIFAMQTKYDFTLRGGVLLILLVCLIIFGIVASFWSSYIVQALYASCGALLASVFFIYDTQLMVGGKHRYNLSPEEYIFGALTLYMDVVRILIYVLRLVGLRK